MILWLFLFEIKSQLLQLFSRTLQLCLTVKLQNCSEDCDHDKGVTAGLPAFSDT